jgi:CheY-like chemotaxis protein
LIVDQTERLALDDARLAAERRREQAERQAVIAQSASAAKDRFLATVSHELRTPLTPALFAASRLASSDGLPAQAKALAATIKRNIESEARLIDDLLDVARIGREHISLRLEDIDVHEILTEAITTCQPIADSRRVAIVAHSTAAAHHVRADRTRLRQVFCNLLSNAVKFTDSGGQIVIGSFNAADDLVRVSVRDNGTGMDAAILERLFAPFDRRPAEPESRAGLGLGLAICKGIIGAHGGQIWATSDGPGRGSTFAVELATVAEPQVAAVESRPGGAVRSADDSPRVRRVLLVEDDHDSCEMLSLFLSMNGYDVVAASSVREAVSRLNEEWDIVLSDIGLPDGSGLDLARRARQMDRPPRRLIALTGYGSHDDICASQQAGFDDHVVKPIDLDTLLDALNGARAPQAQ